MWKEILETKIIRAEGIDLNNLISLIYITDVLTEELNPYNVEKPLELPLKSTCRILLKSVSTGESLSVSFNTRIFDEDGVQWLPLSRSTHGDYLEKIPDEVACPRILMLLHKKVSLDIIKEGGEKSEVGSASEEDYMPEIKLCRSLIESHHYMNSFDDTYEHQGQEVTEVSSAPRFSIGITDDINQELRSNLERLTKTFEIEKKLKESLTKEMESLKNSFITELNEAKKRENDLLEELKNSESRFSSTKFELVKLKHEIKSIQADNSRLQQALHMTEMSQISRIDELTKKIAIYEDHHSESDKILTRLTEFTGICFENQIDKLREKDEIIRKLNKEIGELKHKVLQVTHANDLRDLDELDEAIQRYVMKLKINEPIVKDKEQIYLYNSKKINLLLKEGQLLCRVGGVFKPFEEFVGGSLGGCEGVSGKVGKSLESAKEAEDIHKVRASPTRKSNKSLTLAPKSVKRSSPFN